MASDFIPAARFRFLTPLYDGLCSLVGLGRRLRRFELSLIEGPAPQSVLDVGCGTRRSWRHSWKRKGLAEGRPTAQAEVQGQVVLIHA